LYSQNIAFNIFIGNFPKEWRKKFGPESFGSYISEFYIQMQLPKWKIHVAFRIRYRICNIPTNRDLGAKNHLSSAFNKTLCSFQLLLFSMLYLHRRQLTTSESFISLYKWVDSLSQFSESTLIRHSKVLDTKTTKEKKLSLRAFKIMNPLKCPMPAQQL
jgi:hypothetical protein